MHFSEGCSPENSVNFLVPGDEVSQGNIFPKTAQRWRIDHFAIIDVIEIDLTSIRFIKNHVSTGLGPWERGWERKISDSLLDEPEEKFVKCVRGMLWLCVSDGNRNSSGNKIVVQDEKGLIAEN